MSGQRTIPPKVEELVRVLKDARKENLITEEEALRTLGLAVLRAKRAAKLH